MNELICVGNGYKPPNNHKWGPGVRDVYALHYIMRGKGTLKTRHTAFTLCAGESFILFPQTEIYYYPDPADPWEYVWIEFKGNEAQRLLSMTELTRDKPTVARAPVDLAPLYRIMDNMEMQRYEKLRSGAKLRLLLSYYAEFFPKPAMISQPDYVRSAKAYIENNYWRLSVTVSDIVGAVNIERTYLFRLFKEATGRSVSAYLTAYRMERACELLRSSELAIKSVAYSVGYKDPLYFSRVFKKATSYTPMAYRMLQRVQRKHD